MIMRSLQPRFTRHLMEFSHTDFGSLVQALYGIEKGIFTTDYGQFFPFRLKGEEARLKLQAMRC